MHSLFQSFLGYHLLPTYIPMKVIGQRWEERIVDDVRKVRFLGEN